MKILKTFESFTLNEELTAKQKKLPKALQDSILKKQGKKPVKDEDEDGEKCDYKKVKKSKKTNESRYSEFDSIVSDSEIEDLFDSVEDLSPEETVETLRDFKASNPDVVKNPLYLEKLKGIYSKVKNVKA